MKLSVQEYLDNNRAHLEYVKSPYKPRYAPSYIVSGERADEFVNKYNAQSKALVKNSVLMTSLGLIIGCGMGLSQNSKKISLLIKSCAGALIGLGTGIAISQHEKKKLMDEYHVEELV